MIQEKNELKPIYKGFQFDAIDDRDLMFGSSSMAGVKILSPDGQWEPPVFERQNRNNLETYGCVSFGTLNATEILSKKQFGVEPNFSDRFLVRASGTTVEGNNPRSVYQALRKMGALPEERYPFVSTIKEYYAPLPTDIKNEAEQWADTNDFRYRIVPPQSDALIDALQVSPLGIAVYAWARDGEYYYIPDGVSPAHFCILTGYKKGEFWLAFDTYEEAMKKLAWDFRFTYCCGYTATKKEPKIYNTNWLKDLFWAFRKGR